LPAEPTVKAMPQTGMTPAMPQPRIKTAVPQPLIDNQPSSPPTGSRKTGMLNVFLLLGIVLGGALTALGVYTMDQNKLQTEITTLQQKNNTAIKAVQDQLTAAQQSLTETQQQLASATGSIVPPSITFIQNDKGDMEIRDHDVLIKTVTSEMTVPFRGSVMAQTGDRLFFNVYSPAPDVETDIDANFLPWRHNVFLYDLKTKQVTQLTTVNSFQEDMAISPDGNQFVYRIGNEFTVRDLTTQKETTFTPAVPGETVEIGDVTFSQNGTKLAYATFDKIKKHSAVYILDLITKKSTTATEGDKRIYHIFRWLSNGDADLVTYYFPK
jgi:hypothetical protein